MKNALLVVLGTLVVFFGSTTWVLYSKLNEGSLDALSALLSPNSKPESTPAPDLVKKNYRGQIFIVTRGGESIPLGGVMVSIYPLNQFQEQLKQIYPQIGALVTQFVPAYRAEVEEAKVAFAKYQKAKNAGYKVWMPLLDKAEAEAHDWRRLVIALEAATGGDGYAVSFQSPVMTTQTGVDGRFSVEHASDTPLVVTACAQREVGEDTENYCWFVATDGSKELFLNNHNMFGTNSNESLIQMPLMDAQCPEGDHCAKQVEIIEQAYAPYAPTPDAKGS